MDNLNNKTTDTWLTIAYKLLYDIIFLLLIIFAILLVSEGIVPGFVSAHLNITKLAMIIFAVLGLIIYLGRKLKIEFKMPRTVSKKWIAFGIVFSILLIINSLIKFDWKEMIIITLATFLIFFYLYHEFFS